MKQFHIITLIVNSQIRLLSKIQLKKDLVSHSKIKVK